MNDLERFEILADLYYRDSGHLMPGKSDPIKDTNTDENRQRFGEWYKTQSLESALKRILQLQNEVEELEASFTAWDN